MISTTFKKASATLTPAFLLALSLAGLIWVFVAWDQSYFWASKEDYSFGWLVPAFVGYVIYDRWAVITAAVASCRAPGSPRAGGVAQWVLRLTAIGSMVAGALLFLLGAFYRAGAGASQPGTLAITLGSACLILPLLFFNAPESEAPGKGGLFSDARVRLAAWFLFPALIWLVSAPMVSAVDNQLRLFLLRKVVIVVSFVFDFLGMPVEQQGNVLVLPTGNVGVEDACSGIRSLTGCLFAGSFLASVFLNRLWKKVALVAASLVLAFVTNLGRSLFLTGWAYSKGPDSISGTVHDLAGYAVLGFTVIGLLCLLPLFNLRLDAGPNAGAPPER